MEIDRKGLTKGMDTKRRLFGTFFAFGNRLQAAGDSFYEEITCKQFFLLICLSLFRDMPPTINQLSEVMGSSHQNVKQIINKLERTGFVTTFCDKEDKRKLRVMTTDKEKQIGEKNREREIRFMSLLFDGVTQEDAESTLRVIEKIEDNLIQIKEKGLGMNNEENCNL